MKLIELIGNTPLVELQNLNPNPGVKIFAKIEGSNPGGSVKDRAALGMIQAAVNRGEIKAGDSLVEATSGNTGIALAMIARVFDLKMTLIMPENATEERIKAMRAFGAELILTPATKTIEYSRELAQEMSSTGAYKMLNQFANDDNWKIHYRTTGPEIWRDTGAKVSHFVSAMGTTGTIMGASRYLKEQNNKIEIIGAQPVEGSSIPGIRRWSKAFMPKIFDASRLDRIVDVSEAQARNMAKRLASEEAIFAGMSSGGACSIALQIANEIKEGCIVFIACDRGDRYLSSDLFE